MTPPRKVNEMKVYRQFFAAVAGFGILSTGCLRAADKMDAEPIDALPSDALIDPNTHTGTNGLEPPFFHVSKANLWASMSNQLVVNNAFNSIFETTICSTSSGAMSFHYAFRCAAPAGMAVTCGTINSVGEGIVDVDWAGGGLDNDDKRHVMACVAAHLNPHLEGAPPTVPILLSGEPIKDNYPGLGDYTFPEAIWTTTLSSAGAIEVHAWPTVELTEYCGDYVSASTWLQYRVCGTSEQCGAYIHQTGCTAAPNKEGTYTCNSFPAIESWLLEEDVFDLYGPCTIQ